MGWQQRAKEDKEMKKRDRAQSKSANVRTGNAEYVGYVSYQRTNKEKAAYAQWTDNNPPVLDFVDEACRLGFKFSIAYNPDDDCYKASFYQNNPAREDAGLGISAFAESSWEATTRVVFYLAYLGGFSLLSPVFSAPGGSVKKDFWG